tara:strand:- start:153 stop:536 length:384 start_codon:yes stop_codon:yes gene_type:complete
MVLPQSMRLKGHKCFDHIHRYGERYHGSFMSLKVAKAKPNLLRPAKKVNGNKSLRCAIAISNKVSKKAVIRNRLRRKLQKHLELKLLESKHLSHNWVLISLKPRSSEEAIQALTTECDRLFNKAGLV